MRIHAPRARAALLALAVLLAIGGCGGSDSVTPPPPGENIFAEQLFGADDALEVVTWNLQEFPKNNPITSERVIDAVEAMAADIVAVQEINRTYYFDAMVDAMPGWTGARTTHDSYNLAFLVNDAFVTVIDAYELPLGQPAFPRPPFVLECLWRGVSVFVVNNHLKCCGDGFIDAGDAWDEETRRLAACTQLAAWIRNDRPMDRVIVVGDWNDELTDAPERNVFTPLLEAPAEFVFADMPLAQGGESQWSYPLWPSHIDHILVTDELFAALADPEAMVMTVPLNLSLPQGLSQYVSEITDHRPVAVRLPLTPADGG